MTNTQENHSL